MEGKERRITVIINDLSDNVRLYVYALWNGAFLTRAKREYDARSYYR